MPVKKEPSGRRSVQTEVEVSETPEEVWRTIASEPGISSWFLPTNIDGRVGGDVTRFAPLNKIHSVAKITAWEPPRRFVVKRYPGAVSTEWTVEAKAGGTCAVRVVDSWFGYADDWFDEFLPTFEAHYLHILRLYLADFRGQPCSPVHLESTSIQSTDKAWHLLIEPLGLAQASVGARVTAPADAPEFSGVVVSVDRPEWWPALVLRLDKPAPALAHLYALRVSGRVILLVRIYLYGHSAADVAEEVEKNWQAWLDRRFPRLSVVQ